MIAVLRVHKYSMTQYEFYCSAQTVIVRKWGEHGGEWAKICVFASEALFYEALRYMADRRRSV